MQVDRWGIARRNGAVLMAVGALLLIWNLATVSMAGSYSPQVNMAALGLLGLGLGLVVLPGKKIAKNEVPSATQELIFLWDCTALWRKMVWGVFLIAGLFAGLQLNLLWGGELY